MRTLSIASQCRILFTCSTRRMLKTGSNSGNGSHFVSYHNTGAMLCSEDTGTKPIQRTKRTALRHSGLQQRSVKSDRWQDRMHTGRSSNHLDTPVQNKPWNRNTTEPRGLKPEKESRVSSELRRLSLEDHDEKWENVRQDTQTRQDRHKANKTSKEDRRYEVVFGASPCLLALTQGRRKVHRLIVKEGEASHRASVVNVCEAAHRRGVEIQRVSKRELDRIAAGAVHQGLCLQASPLGFLTEENNTPVARVKGKNPLWLVLDRIQDPMNLGAILRTAYFLGVDRVASSLHNSCPLTPVVSKASSGVMEVMEVYGYKSLQHMVQLKMTQGWQVVGTVGADVEETPTPVTMCSHYRMTKPTLLLMGGEGEGLSPDLLRQCETLLTIPSRRDLHPNIESLNVSVATGIILHSLLSSQDVNK